MSLITCQCNAYTYISAHSSVAIAAAAPGCHLIIGTKKHICHTFVFVNSTHIFEYVPQSQLMMHKKRHCFM